MTDYKNIPLKIAFIEDDPIYAELLQFVIKKSTNYKITHFESAQHCLDRLKTSPDVFIVDHGLPRVSGDDLIEILREYYGQSHFIMLSGQEKVEIALKQMKKGHNYIVKGDEAFEKLQTILSRIAEEKAIKEKKEDHSSKFLPKGLRNFSNLLMLIALPVLFLASGCQNYNYFQSDATAEENAPELFENANLQTLTAFASIEEGADPKAITEMTGSSSTVRLLPDHKISVSIWGHDELSVGSLFSVYSSNEVYGKWLMIPSSGVLQLPQVGAVVLAGKTVEQAEKILREKYAKIILDPLVVIKIHNREVTVLGEVNTPGKILFEKDFYNISDVLAMAGGTTFFANTKKVRLMRSENGKSHDYPINLTKLDAIQQELLSIKAGDVLYIPSQKSQNLVRKSTVLIPISSAITTILLLFTLN